VDHGDRIKLPYTPPGVAGPRSGTLTDVEAQAVVVGDHATPVTDVGDGPPLLVIHSLGLDRRLVAGLVPHLSATRVIAYDLRSHGASTAPPSSFDLPACAADALALLDALGLERAHVAGFSLGGAIAQLAALRAPERVASLVLACTMVRAKRDAYLERARAAEEHGSTEVQVAPTLQRWFSDAALAAEPPYVHYARERVRAASVAQWSAWWRAFSTFDAGARLGELRCPTTVVAGEHDRSTPPAEMRELAERIAGASFHVVPGGSHLTVLEQPAAVAALIGAHLAAR
jgi:3-oxoadipate enol-lactonase